MEPSGSTDLRAVFSIMELLLEGTGGGPPLDALRPALCQAVRADQVVWLTGRLAEAAPPLTAESDGRELRMVFAAGRAGPVCVTFHRTTGGFTSAERDLVANLAVLLTKAAARNTPPAGVTRREAQVLELLGRGLADQQIATQLGISPRTVGKHLEHIYAKLGERGRLRTVTHWRVSG